MAVRSVAEDASQQSWSVRLRVILFIGFALILAGQLAACRRGAASSSQAQENPLIGENKPSGTPALRQAPTNSGAGQQPTVQDEPQDLVIWAPPFMVPSTANEADVVLSSAFARFEDNHVNLTIRAVPKAESGQAGVLSFLRVSMNVAPEILPDIVVLNNRDLWQAADLGLIQPLQPDVLDQIDDWYPAALTSVQYNDQIIGIPYAMDFEHLAYRASLFSKPPVTWDDLAKIDSAYLFAVGTPNDYGGDFLLAQYLAAGGELTADGSVADPAALQAVFEFLKNGQIQGLFPDTVLSVAGPDSAWTYFENHTVDMANVPASKYLAKHSTLEDITFGRMPTMHGQPATIVSVWSLALTTPDPERQALALALINDLLEPSVQGNWSRFTSKLPSRRSSLGVARNAGDPYQLFLQESLDQAVARPNGRAFDDFVHRLQEALRRLFADEVTPSEAVMQVQLSD